MLLNSKIRCQPVDVNSVDEIQWLLMIVKLKSEINFIVFLRNIEFQRITSSIIMKISQKS